MIDHLEPATPEVALPRKTAAARGYGSAWQRFRRAFLAANPLCAACRACR